MTVPSDNLTAGSRVAIGLVILILVIDLFYLRSMTAAGWERLLGYELDAAIRGAEGSWLAGRWTADLGDGFSPAVLPHKMGATFARVMSLVRVRTLHLLLGIPLIFGFMVVGAGEGLRRRYEIVSKLNFSSPWGFENGRRLAIGVPILAITYLFLPLFMDPWIPRFSIATVGLLAACLLVSNFPSKL